MHFPQMDKIKGISVLYKRGRSRAAVGPGHFKDPGPVCPAAVLYSADAFSLLNPGPAPDQTPKFVLLPVRRRTERWREGKTALSPQILRI